MFTFCLSQCFETQYYSNDPAQCTLVNLEKNCAVPGLFQQKSPNQQVLEQVHYANFVIVQMYFRVVVCRFEYAVYIYLRRIVK